MPQGLSDSQINSLAESIFQELAKNVTPQEGITILGITLLMVYERCSWDPRPPVQKYCDDIRNGLIAAWNLRKAPAPTTNTVQ
jgi:hypothetical protein